MSTAYTLITGASSGIGAACAAQLSESSRLILSGSCRERLEQTLARCAHPEQHLLWVCDLDTQREQLFESLSALLTEHEATIENYVHSAGVTQILPIKDFAPRFVDKVFNINFFSAVEILRVLLKKVNQKALRNVVLISALVAKRGDRGNAIYAASKGAINGMVYSLAQELAPIRINAVMPGLVDTPMAQRTPQVFREQIWNRIPLGKGEPEDIANYVSFLLSDQARWITGQTMFVDGGQSTL